MGGGECWLFCLFFQERDSSKRSIILQNLIFHNRNLFRSEELSSFGCEVCFGLVLVSGGGVSVCIKHLPRQFQNRILLDDSSKDTISLLPKIRRQVFLLLY